MIGDMQVWVYIPIAFLCGSIPSGLLIARAKGVDIRRSGSGNIGATNVGRVMGKRYFFLCFACDFLKSCAPVLAAGRALQVLGSFDVPAPSAWLWLGTMVAAVLGNVFNPWLGFKGGKGVATSIGALTGVFPPLAVAGAASFAVWITTLRFSRYISVSSIAAGLALPVAAFMASFVAWRIANIPMSRGVPFVVVAVFLALMVVFTHRANIVRLRAGKEPRVGERAAASPS